MADAYLTEIYRQAKWARSVVWAVFIAALIGALGLRLMAGDAASEVIKAEAAAIVALSEQGKSPREIVDIRTEALYATTDDQTTIENYRPLVRGLAHRLGPLSPAERTEFLARSPLERVWPTMLLVSMPRQSLSSFFQQCFTFAPIMPWATSNACMRRRLTSANCRTTSGPRSGASVILDFSGKRGRGCSCGVVLGSPC